MTHVLTHVIKELISLNLGDKDEKKYQNKSWLVEWPF